MSMPGTAVGKYRITGPLGRGASGIVYKAVDEALGRDVALKILNQALAESDKSKRFHNEAAVLASLNHPGIATIYDLFTSGTELVMVMELVRGETLEQLCDRVGPLSLDRAAYVTDQILSALEHAHRAGIVHRDLKPANIMLTEQGIKIMDFGVARVRGAERTVESHIVGTPAYMAPEQALGESVGESADLYSVGVMFYRVLTGALPFAADTPVGMLQEQIAQAPTPIWRHRSDLPAWCDTIVNQALAKSPTARFQSAGAFRVALGRAAGYSVRQNSALSKLSQSSTTTAAGRSFRRNAVPPGRRRTRVHASLAAFAAGVAALASVPLLYAHPKKAAIATATVAPVFDTRVMVPGGEELAARLTLSDCNLTVTTTSEPADRLHLVPYGSLISTAYAIGRQPLWSSAKGPAQVTRALRPRDRSSVRHWLVVRTNMESRFVVLRFDEAQVAPVLSALEDRSGRAPKIFGRPAARRDVKTKR
jgi:tRNA A-37 threonylcarbamoyl transferase component Bud32